MMTKEAVEKAIQAIKDVESQYADRCKTGSKNPDDYLEMSYYSGVLNGWNFAFHLLEHDVTEQEFSELLNDLLHLEKPC
jgi:hypothetical protein